MLTWNTIECIERNGIITNYAVIFQEQSGANVPGSVDTGERNFSATELTPFSSYTFRVAGVNAVGTGPYSTILSITTDEEGLLNSRILVLPSLINLSPHSSWSCVKPKCSSGRTYFSSVHLDFS